MLRIISCIAIMSILVGCAHSPTVMEIPAMPITKEPNTPFVFKPHYQAKRVGIDEQKVDHHSDFATIVSEAEYVFAPRKRLVDFRADNAPIDTHLKTDSISMSTDINVVTEQPPAVAEVDNETQIDPTDASVMNVSYKPSNEGVCTSIACQDGSECGKIMMCGSQACDSDKRYWYDCTGNECQLTKAAIDVMDAAKFTGMCNEFSDLYHCPTKTNCK